MYLLGTQQFDLIFIIIVMGIIVGILGTALMYLVQQIGNK